jgi:LacI family transcriptional regulator
MKRDPNRKNADTRITLNEIAEHCNVNKSTASRILNNRLENYPLSEETVRRVRAAAEQLGYRPNRMARAVREQRTRLIGLSFPQYTRLVPEPGAEEHLFEQQSLGIYASAVMSHPLFKNYDLVLHHRQEMQGQPLTETDFNTDLLDGLIYLTPSAEHHELLDFAGPRFPIVLLGDFPGAREKLVCTDIDNRKAACAALTHLIESGRRNILALVPERLATVCCIQERMAGYRDALAAAGIPLREELVLTLRAAPETVTERLNNLLFLDRIDALFSPIDELAVFARSALEARGIRVPQQVALCGFNDSPIARQADITSVEIPSARQAYAAADRLLNILEGNETYTPGFHEVETRLVIRGSSAVKA